MKKNDRSGRSTVDKGFWFTFIWFWWWNPKPPSCYIVFACLLSLMEWNENTRPQGLAAGSFAPPSRTIRLLLSVSYLLLMTCVYKSLRRGVDEKRKALSPYFFRSHPRQRPANRYISGPLFLTMDLVNQLHVPTLYETQTGISSPKEGNGAMFWNFVTQADGA